MTTYSKEKTMTLTDEEIKLLAQLEHQMDTGEQPFVVYHGHRIAVSKTHMKRFKLRQAQSINDAIHMALLEANIEECRARMKAH